MCFCLLSRLPESVYTFESIFTRESLSTFESIFTNESLSTFESIFTSESLSTFESILTYREDCAICDSNLCWMLWLQDGKTLQLPHKLQTLQNVFDTKKHPNSGIR